MPITLGFLYIRTEKIVFSFITLGASSKILNLLIPLLTTQNDHQAYPALLLPFSLLHTHKHTHTPLYIPFSFLAPTCPRAISTVPAGPNTS